MTYTHFVILMNKAKQAWRGNLHAKIILKTLTCQYLRNLAKSTGLVMHKYATSRKDWVLHWVANSEKADLENTDKKERMETSRYIIIGEHFFLLSYKRQHHWISFILRTTLIMGGSYQCHTCLREFSRSDSLRRHLESGICKQNEQSEDDPSDDSESQQDDEDDNSTNEEDGLPQSQSSETSPWSKLLQQAYGSLQDTFDETCETYLEQNPGMEIAEAERKAFDELKSNYRQALISNYHGLVKMGNSFKKKKKTHPIHQQIIATIRRRLRLSRSYAWALTKRKFLLERILDNYEMPKLSTTEELQGTSNAK